MEILSYIGLNLLISLGFSLLGLLFDYWVTINGYSRGYRLVVIFGSLFLVFGKPYLFKSVEWWIYSVMILIGLTFLIHQFDLRETMKRGAWWWKREEKKKRKGKAKTN